LASGFLGGNAHGGQIIIHQHYLLHRFWQGSGFSTDHNMLILNHTRIRSLR
jgi:hypothetical protein